MNRILVYGVTGAGKSTLARRIGERLGLPYHEFGLDGPLEEWRTVSEEIQRERVQAVCAGDAWVIDAAYGMWHDLVLERVDLIVGLDLPRWRSMGRLLRRSVLNIALRRPTCNGNRETFRQTFLDRESILLFHTQSFPRKSARMRRWQADPNVPETVLLTSPAEVERWLANL